jgi:hypothetical protein
VHPAVGLQNLAVHQIEIAEIAVGAHRDDPLVGAGAVRRTGVEPVQGSRQGDFPGLWAAQVKFGMAAVLADILRGSFYNRHAVHIIRIMPGFETSTCRVRDAPISNAKRIPMPAGKPSWTRQESFS